MNGVSSYRFGLVAGLAVLLLLPSFDVVLKYTGVLGLTVYFVFGFAGICVFDRFLSERLIGRRMGKTAVFAALLVLAFLCVVAAVGYPIANSGRFGGGSDIDDAMLIGAGEILSGRYPYYPKTYLGGYLSPMPGTLLLSIPFVATGLLAFQNVFWLGILFIVARKFLRSSVFALGLILTPVLIAPTFYQVLVTGSDHAANTIYVLAAMWASVHFVSERAGVWWKRSLAAAALGVGLSSRSVFFFVVPLLFSTLWQTSSFREACKYIGLTVAVFAMVTLPFYIYDPSGFSPLIIQTRKTAFLESVLPHAGPIIGGSALILSIVLGLQKQTRDCEVLFRNCAIVQFFLLLFASTLWAIYSGQFTLYLGTIGYGMFTLFFAAASLWINISKREPRLTNDEKNPGSVSFDAA
jgi:hypothetical protein